MPVTLYVYNNLYPQYFVRIFLPLYFSWVCVLTLLPNSRFLDDKDLIYCVSARAPAMYFTYSRCMINICWVRNTHIPMSFDLFTRSNNFLKGLSKKCSKLNVSLFLFVIIWVRNYDNRLYNAVNFCLSLQLFSEKISGVEGTKLDDEFLDMERVREHVNVSCITDLIFIVMW